MPTPYCPAAQGVFDPTTGRHVPPQAVTTPAAGHNIVHLGARKGRILTLFPQPQFIRSR